MRCKRCHKDISTWKELRNHIDRRHERRDVRRKALLAFERDIMGNQSGSLGRAIDSDMLFIDGER